MTNSTRSATLIQEFLASMDPDAPDGTKGKKMMEDKLRLYLWWKRISRERNQGGKTPFPASEKAQEEKPAETTGRSEGLKLKDQERVQRAVKRRRIRGGAPASGGRVNPESGLDGW
jgi:DNA excision repair protein ERCC-4